MQSTVNCNFKVQMRTGRYTGRARISNDLPLRHGLSLRYGNTTHMSIQSTSSTTMMVIVGNAAQLLIVAGAVNGLILPISLGCMLAASKSKKIVGDYKHPTWLFVMGLVVVIISGYVGIKAVPGILKLFA